MMQLRTVCSILLLSSTLVLTSCASNPPESPPSASAPQIAPDPRAVDLLPKTLMSPGPVRIGTDSSYAPNEFKDAEGNPIGWGVSLTNAIAAKLGLTPDWQISKFDNIIPSITGGKLHIGSSSFTDNPERQSVVDFVNYYQAGVLWASASGNTVDPNNACGLTIAVQSGTFEDTEEIPAKSAACVAAGEAAIDQRKYESQDEATNAVVLGKADAMSADSPVTLYAINKLQGKLQPAGETFDVAPYGFVTEKGGDMTKAVQAALQSLMDDGTYLAILKEWGVESGAVDQATVNAGSGTP